jgi:hypothetical protein
MRRYEVAGLIVALLVGVVVQVTDSEASHTRKHRQRNPLASETTIKQAQGFVRYDSNPVSSIRNKRALEGTIGGPNPTVGSPTIPATCTQQNAASPACYSATQTMRPLGR